MHTDRQTDVKGGIQAARTNGGIQAPNNAFSSVDAAAATAAADAALSADKSQTHTHFLMVHNSSGWSYVLPPSAWSFYDLHRLCDLLRWPRFVFFIITTNGTNWTL